ncbi:MAG: hypothetical protein ACP5UM_13315 [Anaerolineae bacterium]
MRIALVGPCGAGKSALAERLRRAGYEASPVAQEHSYVPDMWQRVARPDILIYLDASLETIQERLGRPWEKRWLEVQCLRLRHAREHCDLYLPTDGKGLDELTEELLHFLAGWQGRRA